MRTHSASIFSQRVLQSLQPRRHPRSRAFATDSSPFGRIPVTPGEKKDHLGRRLIKPSEIRTLKSSVDSPGSIPRHLLSPVNATTPRKTSDDLFGAPSGVYPVLMKNRTWADTERANNPDYFRPLSAGQQPKYYVISCSDSRCPSEMIMGFSPGECFTVRNIAASVMIGDLGLLASTQYAVDVLKVENIIVIGHRDCGGIKAAMSRQSFGTTIDAWVRHVRDVYRQHIVELDAYEDPDEKLNRLIERHVMEQAVNIYKMGFVQRARRNSRVDVSRVRVPAELTRHRRRNRAGPSVHAAANPRSRVRPQHRVPDRARHEVPGEGKGVRKGVRRVGLVPSRVQIGGAS
jgi:carbonic anhydrase